MPRKAPDKTHDDVSITSGYAIANGEPDAPKVEAKAPKWTHDQLKAVRHLGPGIIGQEMYEAAQVFETETKGGMFGPALL